MKTYTEILKTLQDENAFLKKEFHIVKLGVFGSFARNEINENSDLDLLVEFEENTPHLHELKKELRRYLLEKTGMNIDIAREKYLKPYVKNNILAEAHYIE